MMFGYGATDAHYTYDPFGNHLESETIDDAITRFRFAGYKWDNTTGMYNCNARWYDPQISRFTGRDPVKGKFQEPMTLHAYLYCLNDPINRIDPTGEFSIGELKVNISIGAIIGASGNIGIEIGQGNLDPSNLFVAGFIGSFYGAFGGALMPALGFGGAVAGVGPGAYLAGGIAGFITGVNIGGSETVMIALMDMIMDG